MHQLASSEKSEIRVSLAGTTGERRIGYQNENTIFCLFLFYHMHKTRSGHNLEMKMHTKKFPNTKFKLKCCNLIFRCFLYNTVYLKYIKCFCDVKEKEIARLMCLVFQILNLTIKLIKVFKTS